MGGKQQCQQSEIHSLLGKIKYLLYFGNFNTRDSLVHNPVFVVCLLDGLLFCIWGSVEMYLMSLRIGRDITPIRMTDPETMICKHSIV